MKKSFSNVFLIIHKWRHAFLDTLFPHRYGLLLLLSSQNYRSFPLWRHLWSDSILYPTNFPTPLYHDYVIRGLSLILSYDFLDSSVNNIKLYWLFYYKLFSIVKKISSGLCFTNVIVILKLSKHYIIFMALEISYDDKFVSNITEFRKIWFQMRF